MNPSDKDTYEIEINLVEFLKKLILQWKLILILALCGGMLFSGVKYIKERYDISNTVEKTEEEIKLEIENGLNAADKDAVVTLIDRISRVEMLSDYADNAIKMQINPLKCRELNVIYRVETENTADSSAVKAVLEQCIASDEFTEIVADAMGLDAEKNYINEIIKYEDMGAINYLNDTGDKDAVVLEPDAVIGISILLPDGIDEDKVIEDVNKAVKEFESKLSYLNTEINVKNISKRVSDCTDRVVQNEKTSYRTNIISEKSYITSTYKTFTDDQKKYLILIADDSELSMETLEKYIGEKIEESEANGLVDVSVSPQARFSIKYFSFGVVFAVICYTAILFCLCIFNSKAGRVIGFGAFSDFPILGSIKKGDKGQASEIVSAIRFHLDKADKTNLIFLAFGDVLEEINLISNSWEELTGNEIKALELSLTRHDRVSLYESLENIDSKVVAVIKNDSVNIRDMDYVYNLLAEKKIDIIGSVEVL